MIFYQNEYTVGLAITEQGVEVVYTKDVLYDNKGSQTW